MLEETYYHITVIYLVNKTGSLWSNAVPSAKSRSWLRTSSGNSKRHSAWIIYVRKTLHVLVLGLVTVALFESVITALRTYVFSHTTNRIDVELGARLFRHLAALPIAYFESRRAGDSVARVREIDALTSPHSAPRPIASLLA